MLSFPSTLNESKLMYGSGKSDQYKTAFDMERLRALNLNSSVPVLQELLKDKNINISNFGGRPQVNNININNTNYIKDDTNVYYENPLTLPSKLIATAKDYEWIYNKRAKSILNIQKAGKSLILDVAHQSIAPSMFNPQYGVNALGLIANVPLLNDIWNDENDEDVSKNVKDEDLITDYDVQQKLRNDYENNSKNGVNGVYAFNAETKKLEFVEYNDIYDKKGKFTAAGQSAATLAKANLLNDKEFINKKRNSLKTRFNRQPNAAHLSNCSIRELCTLSKKPNSILGQARYKYADFMYCKDLGKVPNNRLITLRRFAHPVGDHIFEMTNPKYSNEKNYSFKQAGDVGRLVAWFDTDDNKLEDIIKFSYHASWKPLTAQIDEKPGRADDSSSGILGMIANSMNPTYNASVGAGISGTHSLFGYLGSKITQNVTQGIGKNYELLTNHDRNKVYEPKDRIQSTHIYDGALEFNHQFTLTFSYVLRGYENINPKSAFLDLIGNILEVTYKRGKFWGGRRKIIGPNANIPMFNKVHQFIDDAWAKAGGFLEALVNGGINFNEILGMIGQGIAGVFNQMMNTAQNAINNPQGVIAAFGQYIANANTTCNISAALKGYMKNAIGRPQLIAWNSLLDGGDVGLWHVTIGNPKNPIVAMGNLILDDATITQSGPLGLDDFPTELKVTVTLKHARPRDITDIGKMYTKGLESLYKGFENHRLTDFYKMQASEAKAIKDAEEADFGTNNPADATDLKNGQTPEAVDATATKAIEEQKAADNKYKEELDKVRKQAEDAYIQQQQSAASSATSKDSNESNDLDKSKQELLKNGAKEAGDKAVKEYIEHNPRSGDQTESVKQEDSNLKDKYNPSGGVAAGLEAYNTGLNLFHDDQLLGYAAENDGPWVNDDIEARIVQSNNYAFEMVRLNISERAV